MAEELRKTDEPVRKPAVRARFQKMILQYSMSRRQSLERRRIWDRRLLDHADSIQGNPRLRDKEADPPEPGWGWRAWRLQGDDAKNRSRWVEGWVPSDLLVNNRPESEPALPLCGRPRRLDEKYAILAAIHNHFCLGVEKIQPWQGPDQSNADEVHIHVLVKHRVPKLTDKDVPVLRAFLADVVADLASQGLLPSGTDDASKISSTISNREAARLYADLTDTKPDPPRIGRLIKVGTLAAESDGRTTEAAIARYGYVDSEEAA